MSKKQTQDSRLVRLKVTQVSHPASAEAARWNGKSLVQLSTQQTGAGMTSVSSCRAGFPPVWSTSAWRPFLSTYSASEQLWSDCQPPSCSSCQSETSTKHLRAATCHPSRPWAQAAQDCTQRSAGPKRAAMLHALLMATAVVLLD